MNETHDWIDFTPLPMYRDPNAAIIHFRFMKTAHLIQDQPRSSLIDAVRQSEVDSMVVSATYWDAGLPGDDYDLKYLEPFLDQMASLPGLRHLTAVAYPRDSGTMEIQYRQAFLVEWARNKAQLEGSLRTTLIDINQMFNAPRGRNSVSRLINDAHHFQCTAHPFINKDVVPTSMHMTTNGDCSDPMNLSVLMTVLGEWL